MPSGRSRATNQLRARGRGRRRHRIGRRRWKNESDYHRQLFRHKAIIGDRLRARHQKSHVVEALIACNILNRMIALGRSESFATGA